MSPPSTTAVLREVDPRIWRACSRASVHIPTLNSRVYHFPQGHVEHCCAPSLISSFPSTTPQVPCIVSSVKLLADPSTDEVFAHLHLQPLPPDKFMHLNPSRFSSDSDQNNVITFTKVLSHSNANNGCSFTSPRSCAESIFPMLDLNVDSPFQDLNMIDMHGFVWESRHIYCRNPKRHVLSRWTKYVNSKKLISGDSVVFMKKLESELFIGVRRAPTSTDVPSFSRSGKGKLTTQAVSEAIGRATNGQPFEVVYYPTPRWSEFVVKAEDVQVSMAISWIPGMRVNMAMETEDSSRITWFQGTLASTYQAHWKQLQIKWDSPHLLKNMNKLNPWQVEVVANSSEVDVTLPPTKRIKYPHTAGFMTGERGETSSFQRGRLSGAATPYPSPYMLLYTTVPGRMQGARQNEFGSFNPTIFIGENPPQTIEFFSPLARLGQVSTETNVGSAPSNTLSLNSTNTNQSSGNDLVGNQAPFHQELHRLCYLTMPLMCRRSFLRLVLRRMDFLKRMGAKNPVRMMF